MQEKWQDRQLPGRVIDITPSVVSDSLLLSADLEQTSPAALHCKGAELPHGFTTTAWKMLPMSSLMMSM